MKNTIRIRNGKERNVGIEVLECLNKRAKATERVNSKVILLKTDSAQRSSNKCKKYLPKNYS